MPFKMSASSRLISTGTPGTHHSEGVGVGFAPPLFDQKSCDEIRGIDEADAREMARRLAREKGIYSGTSTGINVAGVLQLARELGPGQTAVTVAVDTGLKYLTGGLFMTD